MRYKKITNEKNIILFIFLLLNYVDIIKNTSMTQTLKIR